MKKILCTYFILFLASLCFSFPNMKLYENARFVYQISDNAIYNAHDVIIFEIRDGALYNAFNNEYAGTISESGDMVVIDRYFKGEKTTYSEYSKRTGFLLLQQTDWDASEYDEKTGLIRKYSNYKNGQLDSYNLYEHEKDKIMKTTYYKADGSFDGLTQFEYDKKTGNKIKESYFDADNHLVQITEFDTQTKRRIKQSEYNIDGSLKTQTTYDKNSGYGVEQLIYESASKKPIKQSFIKFDDDGNYALGDGVLLSTTFHIYSMGPILTASLTREPIDWNENYSATVRKYEFNKNTAGYSHIENLKKRNYLFDRSFTLCNKNSNLYYLFVPKDNKIDFSLCYEIELIKKVRDWSAMNKSGKGSGPFGFDIGMTYEEVKAACGGSEPEHIADEHYYVKPKKAHPLFEKYIVWISDAVGLYYIKGISRDISVSDYGTEAKQQFESLLLPLEKKYGKFTLTDTVKPDYYWKTDKYWMQALKDGARTYNAAWTASRDNESDGLLGIMLGIDCTYKYSTSNAYIWIEYIFQNYSDAKEALNDVL